jgi:hypothetical protein
MQPTIVDGVPVFFAEGPGPVTAGLLFGVGRRDESFVRGGLTHLVEHLAMHGIGRTTLEVNASVSLDVTEFTATGPGEAVAAFLTAVCRSLDDLPVDRLAVEADVLRTEGGQAAPPFLGGVLAELYGATGLGLAGVREPAVRSLTAEDVHAWARRWFVRENAAVWLAGPALPPLDLPLRTGSRRAAVEPPRQLVATPAWGDVGDEGRIGLLAELPDAPALAVTLGVLAERLEEELRHRRGIAYSVQVERVPVAPGRRLAVITTDLREGQDHVATSLLWRELLTLATDGPRDDELAHDRALLEQYLADPRAAAGEAHALAEAHVTGDRARTGEQLRAEHAALTLDDVRTMAAAMRDAAFLAVPDTLDPPPPGLSLRPAWWAEELTGRQFARRKLSGVPRGATLVVGEEGASLRLDAERLVTVRWADAVGLVRTGQDEHLLVGRDGATLPLVQADWRDGGDVVATALRRVPVDLQVVGDDALDEGGVLLFRASAKDVREAIALSRETMAIGGNAEWTIVVPDRERPLATVVEDLSTTVGRRTVALVLRRTHVDLAYELYRSGKPIGRHRWGVADGDPGVLAEATGRSADQVAALHSLVDPPDEVLRHAVVLLGLPPEVAQLIDGERVGDLEPVVGRGIAGGFTSSVAAAVRESAVPATGGEGLRGRWQEAQRARPAWYRALYALAAVVSLVILSVVIASDVFDGSPVRRVYVGVLAVVGLLTSLWRARPRQREDSLPDAVQGA